MIYYSEFNFDKLNIKTVKDVKGNVYCNNVFTFDIETSTAFYINGTWQAFDKSLDKSVYKECPKLAWCYIWQFSIDEEVVYGRRLEEFKIFLDTLLQKIHSIAIIYIHNASYEFQFLRNVLDFTKVFAREKRKPIYFEYSNAVFRCSFLLSRMSLSDIGKRVNKIYKKMDGDLVYSLLRFSDTELNGKELKYCENDCLVLYEYINNLKKEYRNRICEIPLTQTGRVRRELQKLYRNDKAHIKKCQSLVPSTMEFLVLRESFQGGLTRAIALWTGQIVANVWSFDSKSDYPYQLVSQKFPCTHFVKRRVSMFLKEQTEDGLLWIAKIRFIEIQSKAYLRYIASHKCLCHRNATFDNGRLIYADMVELTITNVDYECIKNLYKFDSEKMQILEYYTAKSDYLDDTYRNYVLQLFQNKCTLKEKDPVLYAKSKEFINALYGDAVTNLITPDIIFNNDNGWTTGNFDLNVIAKLLKKRRNDRKCINTYATGVFVPAYARKMLVDMFLCVGNDTIYMDTDSLKGVGNHEKDFEMFNKQIFDNLKNALSGEQLKMAYDSTEKVYLGQFCYEETYKKFITYGAKKYAYEDSEGELHLTVSGLSKKASAYLSSIEEFTLEKEFNYDESGRVILTYDDEQEPTFINGHYINYKYGIQMQPTTYTLNMTPEYKTLAELIQTVYEDEPIEHQRMDFLNNRKTLKKFLKEHGKGNDI